MKRKTIIIYSAIACLLLQVAGSYGQEHKGPLCWNPYLFNNNDNAPKLKTTALTLPFFEDFTDYDLYPNHGRWVENQVYINNTMCVSPISRGVATLDALNEKGLPWVYSNTDFASADSLTSQPINLSPYTPADSLYLSFFYQPQGNGYFPLAQDTLFVYMKVKYGDWVPVWRTPGTSLAPFKQIMIPITDTLFLHSSFQFRFSNIAALNWADAIWNVDYVRLDINRNMNDTAFNDIGFSSDPSFLLNDYTSMPYRQFYAYPVGERTAFIVDSINNNNKTLQPLSVGFSARALNSASTVLRSPVMHNITIPPATIASVSDSAYTITITPGGPYDKVVFENKYFFQSTAATGSIPNDTIIKNQVFDNYLAYDDGTAEQSYYLTLYPSLPGKLEVEYHLNIPDTMRGMAIYFGRQVPSSSYKLFDIEVYSALSGINGATADNVLYRQEACSPGYADTVNHFWVYKFDNPVALPAGTFYTGAFMPALSGDDSLYFGFDVNRVGGNHAYYNVASAWVPSSLQGAIMMRPLLGQYVTASSVPVVKEAVRPKWEVTPNPAQDKLNIYFPGDEKAAYRITNIQGQTVLHGQAQSGTTIDIEGLKPGMYFVSIALSGLSGIPQKFIKL